MLFGDHAGDHLLVADDVIGDTLENDGERRTIVRESRGLEKEDENNEDDSRLHCGAGPT
jgi:hypothetical protein